MTPIKAKNLFCLVDRMAHGDQLSYALSIVGGTPTVWILVKDEDGESQFRCYRESVKPENLYSEYTRTPSYTSDTDYKFFIVSVPSALEGIIQQDWHHTLNRSTITI